MLTIDFDQGQSATRTWILIKGRLPQKED